MSAGPQLLVDWNSIGGAGWFRNPIQAVVASKLNASTTATAQRFFTQNTPPSFTQNALYELIVEAMAGEINHLVVYAISASGANSFGSFYNLATMAAGTYSTTGFTDTSRAIEDLGSNRRRLTFRFRPTSAQGVAHTITGYMSSTDGVLSYAGTAGQGLTVYSVSLTQVLAPTNSLAPSIAGTPQVGATLTLTPGTWSDGTLSRKWYVNTAQSTTGGTEIAGQTGTTLAITSALASTWGLAGNYVYAVETATNTEGLLDVASNILGRVTIPRPNMGANRHTAHRR